MINALEADKQTYQYLQALCKAAFSDLDELIRDAIKSGEFQVTLNVKILILRMKLLQSSKRMGI